MSFLGLFLMLMHAEARSKSFLVVLDPGHGGEDAGASFLKGKLPVYEKNVTLLLARDLQKELENRSFKVFLTRNADRSLALSERTALANRVQADLFVSIHMNAGHSENDTFSRGFETYILSQASDESSKRLAALENSANSVLEGSQAILLAKDADQPPEVALILKDLTNDANIQASREAACLIQHHLSRLIQSPSGKINNDRGVKQALFYVLLGADMPSVLIESGFIRNALDRTMILSELGRKSIAKSIAEAIHLFRAKKSNPCKISSS